MRVCMQYANRARNIQNKPVVNRDANSMVINELREKVQALATELLRMREGGGAGGGNDGEVSAETLRELAVTSTPARQAQRPLTRASSSRLGAVDASAPVQRELTMLRARAAEAEGEVVRLTEEAKRARKRESNKDDALAELKAELDLAHADVVALRGGTGTDQLMMDIAEAAAGKSGDAGGVGDEAAAAGTAMHDKAGFRGEPLVSSGEENVSPKVGFGGVIKGFFSTSAGSTRCKSPGSSFGGGNSSVAGEGGEEAAVATAAATASVQGPLSSDARLAKPEAPREKAFAVVKDFHRRIQGLEEKLQDSERQRAALERQLVHNSGGGGGGGIGNGTGGAAPLTVGLSAKLAAAAAGDAGELSTDAVAEANKR